MDEYIDRDKAIKAVSDWYRKALHPENMSSYNEGERDAYRTALSEIANLPAADVRPVVFCGDCAYCKKVDQYERWCHGFCNPPRLVAADDFCSHGRRPE